jgi:hypothetical protein
MRIRSSFNLSKDDPELCKHPRVYSVAEYIDAPNLRSACVAKFEKQLETNWFSDSFPEAIKEVFNSTIRPSDPMRELVTKVARLHLDDLMKNESFLEVLMHAEGFAGSVLKQVVPMCSCRGYSWNGA